MQWCDVCGDVDTACDAARCDQHRCSRCNAKLSHEEHDYTHAMGGDLAKWCFRCTIAGAVQHAMDRGRDEIAAGCAAADEIEPYRRASG